jgi:hypothetical protein
MTDIIEHDDIDYCSTHHAYGVCYPCNYDETRWKEENAQD